MKEFYLKYLNEKFNFNKKTIVAIFSFLIVIAGMFGWLYEFIFYYFNGGMKEFYWRGGNFLPWINIYATGSIMVCLFTYRFRKKPFLVFLISFITCGLLEYFSGLGIYIFTGGDRYWNYNTEILNFGNIDGFVCLRSVMFFAVASLFLIYVVLPLLLFFAKHINRKLFFWIGILLCMIILADEFYNLLVARMFDLPRARDIYTSLGIPYVKRI